MKPIEARTWLQQATQMVLAGQPLPPALRAWLGHALRRRVEDPHSSLDGLLGLRSRRGGRLHAFSPLPARDQALAALAAGAGAEALRARILAHCQVPDAALAEIERTHGRLPRSLRQLQRIVAGHTVASQMNR